MDVYYLHFIMDCQWRCVGSGANINHRWHYFFLKHFLLVSELHLLVQQQYEWSGGHLTPDTWRLTPDTWLLTPDTWHDRGWCWLLLLPFLTWDRWCMTPDIWHLAFDNWKFTFDTWNVEHDTYQAIHDTWLGGSMWLGLCLFCKLTGATWHWTSKKWH